MLFHKILILSVFACISFIPNFSYASNVTLDDFSSKQLNINGEAQAGANRNNSYLEEMYTSFSDFWFTAETTGEKGARNFLFRIARDVKNLFLVVATVYLFIGVFNLIGGPPSPESRVKWRNQILWTGIGIVVMQISFVFVSVIYDRSIGGGLALDLLEKIVYPFIKVMKYLAATLFLAMMFYAVYTFLTGAGDEEASKKGKSTLTSAIIGFLLIQVPEPLVMAIYGKAVCKDVIFGICRAEITNPNLSGVTQMFVTFINYVNGFIALVSVLMLIYAGWLTFTAGTNEENFKKAKNIFLYAAMGIILIIASYMLLNFFLLRS